MVGGVKTSKVVSDCDDDLVCWWVTDIDLFDSCLLHCYRFSYCLHILYSTAVIESSHE